MKARISVASLAVIGVVLASLIVSPERSGAAWPGRDGLIYWGFQIRADEGGAHQVDSTGVLAVSPTTGTARRLAYCVTHNRRGHPNYCERWESVSVSASGDHLLWDILTEKHHDVIVRVRAGRRGRNVPIAHGAEDDASPSFAPDGTSIVYAVYGKHGGAIVASDLDGRHRHVLFRGTVDTPIYSPEGNQIVFQNRSQLWTMTPTGGHPHELLSFGLDPDFSPDGRQIVYAGGNYSIGIVNSDGSHAHPVKCVGCAEDLEQVRFAPDGRQLAIVQADPVYGPARLSLLPVGGGRPKLLLQLGTAKDSSYASGLAWEPLP